MSAVTRNSAMAYFLVAGAHPAWGYPDQPPLTPLFAWATTSLLGDSLVALRLPSALAIAVAALLAREFGAGPGRSCSPPDARRYRRT